MHPRLSSNFLYKQGCMDKEDLGFLTSLPPPLYPLAPVYVELGMESRALNMLGKHTMNGATSLCAQMCLQTISIATLFYSENNGTSEGNKGGACTTVLWGTGRITSSRKISHPGSP